MARPKSADAARATIGKRLNLLPGMVPMPWVRIDDGFAEHPKLAEVGPLGMALQIAALCYCNQKLTDGFIPWTTARSLLSWEFLGIPDEKGRKRYKLGISSGMVGDDVTSEFVIGLLVEAGIWEETQDGYQIHDYLDFQPSREDVLAQRQKTATRVSQLRNRRSNTVSNAVTTPGVTPAPVPVPVPVPVPPLSTEVREESSAKALSPPKTHIKKVYSISEEYRVKMRDRYKGPLGDTVDDRIAAALAHKAVKNYPDGTEAYVNNWLRNDVDRMHPARNGFGPRVDPRRAHEAGASKGRPWINQDGEELKHDDPQ